MKHNELGLLNLKTSTKMYVASLLDIGNQNGFVNLEISLSSSGVCYLSTDGAQFSFDSLEDLEEFIIGKD